jgi:hypothetical protein
MICGENIIFSVCDASKKIVVSSLFPIPTTLYDKPIRLSEKHLPETYKLEVIFYENLVLIDKLVWNCIEYD